MPIYSFDAIAFSDLTISGPDPFVSNAGQNSAAISNNTQITISGSGAWTEISVIDGDTTMEDNDYSQDLATAVDFNGTTWSAGTDLEIEYSYVIRPVGSTDPGEQITIYVLEFDGVVQGITADTRLAEGITYEIIAGGSGFPTVAFSNVVVCFTGGTRILTPDGPCLVESLRPGDEVMTLGHGAQPLAWVGAQEAPGYGRTAPCRVGSGVLGNDAPLELSPQHRVLAGSRKGGRSIARALGCIDQACLLPIKALAGGPWEIARAPRLRVRYHHLLLARHEIIFANGAAVESMLPGPMALAALDPIQRREVLTLFPGLARGDEWISARPILRVGAARRRLRRMIGKRRFLLET